MKPHAAELPVVPRVRIYSPKQTGSDEQVSMNMAGRGQRENWKIIVYALILSFIYSRTYTRNRTEKNSCHEKNHRFRYRLNQVENR